MSAPVLECQAVRKTYDQRVVLKGLSLTLHRGERLALTGPSGCGKTTLLNCLGGIDRPDSGNILLLGQDIVQLTADELASLRRERIGTIFQFFHLLPTLTVRENIEFPLQLLGVPPTIREERSQNSIPRSSRTPRRRFPRRPFRRRNAASRHRSRPYPPTLPPAR